MKKGVRYVPPLVIALSLTIAGSPTVLNIPPSFFYGGIIACILIIILCVRDIVR